MSELIQFFSNSAFFILFGIPIVIKDSLFGKEKAPRLSDRKSPNIKQYKVTYDRSIPGLSQSQKPEFLFTIGIYSSQLK
jgi:hypothetical protein